MQSNQDDVRDRLERLATDLMKLEFPAQLNVEDAHWLAECIQSFLAGKQKSLDDSLGLVRTRGGQMQHRKKELVAQTWASNPALTWEELAALVCQLYPQTFPEAPDESQMRRDIGGKTLEHWTPTATRAIGDEVASRLNRRKSGHESE